MWKYNESLIQHKQDPPTQAQLDYIKHIWHESDHPLHPFTGKTRLEASKWIEKNKYWAYRSYEENE